MKEKEKKTNPMLMVSVPLLQIHTEAGTSLARTKLSECLSTSGLHDGTSGKCTSRRRLGAIEGSARDTREDDRRLSLADCRVASLGLDGKRTSLGLDGRRTSLGLDGRRATLYMVVAHLGGSGLCTRAGAAGVL